jgi:hypothetical protein
MRGTMPGLRIALLGAALSCVGTPAVSQTAPPEDLPRIGGPLVPWVTSRPHAAPNSLPDFASSDERLAEFRSFVDALARRDWPRVRLHANALAYQVAAVQEAGAWFVVASEGTAAGRDPTVVISLDPRRDVVLESPHVPFEAGTAEQAVVLLRELGGRAAVLAGPHRCASRSFTACSGSTAVCGTTEGYRDSDAGHNTRTLFHVAHLALSELWPGATVISLHGMKEDAEGVKTSAIVSSGIRADDPGGQLPATRFRLSLDRLLAGPGAIVSCNFPPDLAFGYRRLCGFTNVQGRHVNGGQNACLDSVDRGTGRFIHVEQDWSILRPYAEDWDRISQHPINHAFVQALSDLLPPVFPP